MSRKKAKIIRNRISDDYYDKVYQSFLFGGGAQGKGIRYFENQVENFWVNSQPKRVLEIGGGNGEHLPFISYVPIESYTSIDLRPLMHEEHSKNVPHSLRAKLIFVQGNAESLPFKDLHFDRVFTTCLLHHVDDVLAVLLEARRVTEQGGEIAFVFPTDPGVFNQLIKRFVTFRRLGKLTTIKPQLIYAFEHKNHVLGIIEQIKYVFALDDLNFHYRPFRFFRSWNLNLLVVAKIVKR
jgi:ubiquinone/menaquinone biosynthesis C-methylase UbiE